MSAGVLQPLHRQARSRNAPSPGGCAWLFRCMCRCTQRTGVLNPIVALISSCLQLEGVQAGLLEQFLTHVWAPKLALVVQDPVDKKICQVCCAFADTVT